METRRQKAIGTKVGCNLLCQPGYQGAWDEQMQQILMQMTEIMESVANLSGVDPREVFELISFMIDHDPD